MTHNKSELPCSFVPDVFKTIESIFNIFINRTNCLLTACIE